MNLKKSVFLLIPILLPGAKGIAQSPQGFFLEGWQPLSAPVISYSDISQTALPVSASVVIHFNDTITKVPAYMFGDNSNLYTGCMSDNPGLMKHLSDRRMGVLRGPSGSISDIFFWNRSVDQKPTDIPPTLAGQTGPFEPWYGVRPYPWETWTMSVDSFYSILNKVNVTGMLTVNYGYARYGTSSNPVSQAAHMAADWVRYDNGRTKFWEIGNEVSGNWEAGYQIDPSLNRDGQPEFINGTLYGEHCLVFIDSMKTAAQQLGLEIRIGLVMAESPSASLGNWNQDVAAIAGDEADFYVVHNYFTPYNQNSGIETILNSPPKVAGFRNYIYQCLDLAGKPHLPLALTEYNIFATGSKQAVSCINGLHGIQVIGETLRQQYGAALRWDLANGWNNGDDQGMYSFGQEPGVQTYAPRPAFYYLYFMRKFMGDILLNSGMRGDTNVIVYPTAFSSGQVSAVLINKGRTRQVLRLNISNFKFGDRYYYYTLTGGEDNGDFSSKVFINGEGNNLVAGGPDDYETINAFSSLIDTEIVVALPSLSATYILVPSGNKELVINEEISGIFSSSDNDLIQLVPNPCQDKFTVENIPAGYDFIRISDLSGKIFYSTSFQGKRFNSSSFHPDLKPGMYLITLSGNGKNVTKKLVVK